MINQAGQDGATLRAVRVTEPLEIDGVLDEPFYRSVPPISEFVQGVPEEDGEPSELTEVWIGFDDNNVYVSAKIWDTAGPDGWIANEMRRDSQFLQSNDHFGVYLDTFYDRRNAASFSGNSVGGFNDGQFTNEGSVNRDWNPIWETRPSLFDGGWSIEMAIPFKSLRYRPGREQVWGIQMKRTVLRRNETNFIRALPLSVAGGARPGTLRVSMYGTLVGIEAPPPSRNLEVKPYGIAGSRTDLAVDPQISNDGYADAGLDVKYGITENLTADFTYNTDFAQVEVDEQQVNLTRFSLFFPEKREFFLEGRGIFSFGDAGGGGGAPTMFFSRRIGLQGGEPVPILGGGRVTGKVGSFDVGLLSIQTDAAASVGAKSTNFSVVRLKKDIFARSSVGVLFENRSRSLIGRGSNQAWGVDGFLGLSDDLGVLAYYAKTETDGLNGLDASYRGRISYSSDQWGGTVDHLVVGDDFNPEIGFVRRKRLSTDGAVGTLQPPHPLHLLDPPTHVPVGLRLPGKRTGRVRREPELGRPVQCRVREQRSVQRGLHRQLREPGDGRSHLGSDDPGRPVLLPRRTTQLQVGTSASLYGQPLPAPGRLLRWHPHLCRAEQWSHGGHATDFGGAQHLLQLDRPTPGPVRPARRGDTCDLHADTSSSRERPRPIQLAKPRGQRQLPLPVGVGPRERAVPRLHRGS